jgi:hypothetical protein
MSAEQQNTIPEYHHLKLTVKICNIFGKRQFTVVD